MAAKTNPEVLNAFIRYMIQAAQNKRVVPYYELENVFGLSHNMVALYSYDLGYFCVEQKIPLLNALIISSTTGRPSNGFDGFEAESGMDWGSALAQCWSHFHVTSSRASQVQNFTGLNQVVRDWHEQQHADEALA